MNMQLAPPSIQIGRRVKYTGDMCNQPGDGLIVAIHGNPGQTAPEYVGGGFVQILRSEHALVDITLFDGRAFPRVNEHAFGKRGARFELLARVHGRELIEVAKRAAAKRQADAIIAKTQEADRFHRTEAARVIDNPPLFYWNGIKDAKGAKLQKCWYSDMGANGSATGKYPPHTLSIYARDYNRFSTAVRDCFEIENNTDTMTDYFDSDHIRVIPSHPLHVQVRAAFDAQAAHRAKRAAKRGGSA